MVTDNIIANALDNKIDCPMFCCDIPCFIQFFTSLIFPLAALGLLTALIYAGFLRISAASNVEKVKRSNQIIQASLLGFVIIVLSGVIVETMCALLGVKCF